MTHTELLSSGRASIEICREAVLRIVEANNARDTETLFHEWNTIQIHLGNAGSLASLFSHVHPDRDIREAAESIEQEVQVFATALSLDRAVFDVFAAVDQEILLSDEKRLVEKTLRDFRRSGVDKEEKTREKIKELSEELVKIGQTFERNIREDIRYIDVSSVNDLAGLPEDYIAAHAPGEDGNIRITTDYPDLKPFMMYAKNKELRKQLSFLAKNQAYPKNISVLQELLEKRHLLALLLGYASWADYVAEDKMIKNAVGIRDFVERIYTLAKPIADKEKDVLLEEKRKDEPDATEIFEWEYAYYEEKVKNERFYFDSRLARPYFEYARVKQGIFDTTSDLFGLRYERVEGEVWHPQVEIYDVYDGEEKRGRFFLDMHPRECKYKHAAQFSIKAGVNGVQLPESALVCNFTNPKTD